VLNFDDIESEIMRVFSETGEYPRVVFVDSDFYRALLRHAHSCNFDYHRNGVFKLRYVGVGGEVEIRIDKYLPPNTIWAGIGDYADYWARRILMDDKDEGPSNR